MDPIQIIRSVIKVINELRAIPQEILANKKHAANLIRRTLVIEPSVQQLLSTNKIIDSNIYQPLNELLTLLEEIQSYVSKITVNVDTGSFTGRMIAYGNKVVNRDNEK